VTVASLCTDCEKDYPEADCHRDAANLRQRAEDLESQLSAEVSARDLTIRDLRSRVVKLEYALRAVRTRAMHECDMAGVELDSPPFTPPEQTELAERGFKRRNRVRPSSQEKPER